jgi:hypothetical protein
MKKNIKILISAFVCIAIIFCFTVPAFAAKGNNSNNSKNNSKNNIKNINKYITGNVKCFDDVKENHWAYKYIMWMLERDIVHGIGNNKFNPNGTVTRAEFAKMMVRTLDLKLSSPDKQTFEDVNKKAWEYPYVESSKNYLTYYRTSTGNYFKPSQPSVREDMAVALVKALGYQDEAIDESILNQFADADEITPSIRKYVALSVKYGLMKGIPKDGKLYFGPMNNLTRAEAATLLYRAFVVKEEKVPYEEDKLPYEDDDYDENDEDDDDDIYIKPVVTVTTSGKKLIVNWNKIDSPKFQGYRVVISKNDPNPAYPKNGYLFYITDKNQTSAVIDNSIPYAVNSDFGDYLEKGVKYYISVTAEYSDKFVAGNAVRKTYPGESTNDTHETPVVYTSVENGILVLRWNKINSKDFKEYRVVISKNDSTPDFDDGYLYRITDSNKTFAVINNTDKYTGGDFGNYLTKGEKYYFTVVAVYEDEAVTGNVVQYKYDGAENPDLYVVPEVNAYIENGKLVLRWKQIDSPKFVDYRVVASKSDSTPGYPENGYLYAISDRTKNYAIIDNTTEYTNGDFDGYFIKGEKYYFSIAAVYSDKIVTGNAIQVQYNGDDSPVMFPAPVVSATYEDGNLVVKWDKIDSPQLVEYRLVISEENKTPAYPADGFYDKPYSPDTTAVLIDRSKTYTDGDFSTLTYGNEYYFSVTAVYKNNKYVAGNPVKVLYLVSANN